MSLAIAGFVLAALQTAYSIYKSETQEEPEEPLPGIQPPLDTGGLGAPQVDLPELGQVQRQPVDYSGGGSTLGQAMAGFQPMRLGDVLRPQIDLGEDGFSLGRGKRFGARR